MSNTPRSLSPRGITPNRQSPSSPFRQQRGTTSGSALGGATNSRTQSQSPTQVDPFLQQSQDIRLTERDRQEGYDVDLLNSKPRTGGTKRSTAAGAGLAGGVAGVGAEAAYNNSSQSGLGGGRTYDGATVSNPESTATNAEKHGLFTSSEGNRPYQRKPWYMRKLTILVIVLLIAAAALAIGLGVGLSEKKHDTKKDGRDNSTNDNANASGSSSASVENSGRSESRNATATYNTSSRTRGTVIPSSLYSQYTDTMSDFTSPVSSSDAPETESPSPTSMPAPALPTDLSNTFEGTTRASTGNLPIPADSVTTVGSVVYSSISALGGLDRRKRTEVERITTLPMQTASSKMRLVRRRRIVVRR